MAEFHLYDFDGTLFRSPHEPMIWEGEWWNDIRSLMPPCVPDRPGSEWWVGSVVSQAKKSIGNSDVLAVMSTGRLDKSGFRYRIPELLKQKGLNFDEVRLAPPQGTLSFKKSLLASKLRRYPEIDVVRIWDDRPSHLRAFKELAEKLGIEKSNIHLHHIRATSMAPLCDEEELIGTNEIGQFDMKGKGKGKQWQCRYMAIFLDARSKAALAKEYSFLHDKIKNDHLTLTYLCKDEKLKQLVGQRVSLKVIGHAADDKGQAVVVSGYDRLDGGVPHVTLSHSGSVGPKYSNDLLKKGWERVNGPTLRGVIDSFPRSLKRTASAHYVGSMFMRSKM